MANYGVPYKGSKNRIAKQIVDFLPSGGTLYDLFAGGCAIAHCAMESGKWDRYVINDIEPGITQLFKDAIDGKYKKERRWISREMFESLKDSDPYVRYCWSFGSNGVDYIYSKKIELYKKAVHEMLFEPDVFERKRKYRRVIKELETYMKRTQRELEGQNDSFCGLQSLERLERLQSLERLESLESYSVDYRNIKIEPDSVIYCDIPYKNTSGYGGKKTDFDYESFYNWACSQNVPVFISEYNMPEDRFECVLELKKQCNMAATTSFSVTEKLFIPRKQSLTFKIE